MSFAYVVERDDRMDLYLRMLAEDGFVVLEDVLSPNFLQVVEDYLDHEWLRRLREGESQEDIKAREERGHYMASYENSPVMDLLSEAMNDAIQPFMARNWLEANRQIVWRTYPGESPISNHLDGLDKVLKEGLEDIWPGFQLLAGLTFNEICDQGQGGLLIRKGSHREVLDIYHKVIKSKGHIEALKEIKRFVDDSDDGTLLMMKPGDIALIHPLVIHRPDVLKPETWDTKCYLRLKTTKKVGRKALKKVISF